MSSRIISKKERVFDWVNTLFMLIVIVLTLYPFWYVIVASVSSISHVTNSVVLLWPDGLNWDAYQQVFRNNLVPTAYGNTLFITIIGTVISMLLTCTSAFVLSRRELPGRNLLTLLVVFTMLFNAGLVPFYLLVRDVGLLDTRWSLILPFAVSTYNTIIMRNFFQGVPNALYEAASIDGCSYFKYFLAHPAAHLPAVHCDHYPVLCGQLLERLLLQHPVHYGSHEVSDSGHPAADPDVQ